MTVTTLQATRGDDDGGREVTDGAVTKDFTTTAFSHGRRVRRRLARSTSPLAAYIELGGEIIDGKMRLTAANARRVGVSLIDAADDFDGRARSPTMYGRRFAGRGCRVVIGPSRCPGRPGRGSVTVFGGDLGVVIVGHDRAPDIWVSTPRPSGDRVSGDVSARIVHRRSRRDAMVNIGAPGVVTGPQDCTCANLCPDYAHCACIADLEKHVCHIYCTDETLAAKRADSASRADDKFTLDRRVRLEMHGASLGEAGALIADTVDAEIYVPANRIDERRDLSFEDVSLETVVRELGLMAFVRP